MSAKKGVPSTTCGFLLPNEWIDKLKILAEEETKKRKIRVTYLDLIRESAAKTYGLSDWVNGRSKSPEE